ncbi:MAG: membrane fusion protein (multidrug efflux system) [Paraglaciecola psychrophila]|jgi:membrane fusion protein (multidrug efflux system)
MNIHSLGRKLILLLLLLLALAVAANWVHQRMTHVYSDDARIAADMVDIGSKVSGWIVSFAIASGDQVKRGDILAVVDSQDTVLKLRQLQAKASALTAGYEAQQAEITMVEQHTSGAYRAASSQLTSALAALAAATTEQVFRSGEWQRSRELRDKKILSLQDFEAVQSQYRQASQARDGVEADVASARAGLSQAQANQSRLLVMARVLAKLEFERESLQLELQRQQVDLNNRTIVAPSDGIIDGLYMDPGEHVLPGMRMLLMHNPEDIWISANVKETEVRFLLPGQPVAINVDAYPDTEFSGEVIKIGHAATSEFALLPSTNPSGNFTKVTQRLQVKISLAQQQLRLKPGMMVEVAIDVR